MLQLRLLVLLQIDILRVDKLCLEVGHVPRHLDLVLVVQLVDSFLALG